MKVKDLPKLAALMMSRLRSVFVDEIVFPSFKKIHLPPIPLPGVPSSLSASSQGEEDTMKSGGDERPGSKTDFTAVNNQVGYDAMGQEQGGLRLRK